MWADALSIRLLITFAPFLALCYWVGHDAASVRRRFRDDLRTHSLRLGQVPDDELLEAYARVRGGFWRRLSFEAQRAALTAVFIVALVECSVADIAFISKLFVLAMLTILFNQVVAPAMERPLAQRLITALLEPATTRIATDSSLSARSR